MEKIKFLLGLSYNFSVSGLKFCSAIRRCIFHLLILVLLDMEQLGSCCVSFLVSLSSHFLLSSFVPPIIKIMEN